MDACTHFCAPRDKSFVYIFSASASAAAVLSKFQSRSWILDSEVPFYLISSSPPSSPNYRHDRITATINKTGIVDFITGQVSAHSDGFKRHRSAAHLPRCGVVSSTLKFVLHFLIFSPFFQRTLKKLSTVRRW